MITKTRGTALSEQCTSIPVAYKCPPHVAMCTIFHCFHIDYVLFAALSKVKSRLWMNISHAYAYSRHTKTVTSLLGRLLDRLKWIVGVILSLETCQLHVIPIRLVSNSLFTIVMLWMCISFALHKTIVVHVYLTTYLLIHYALVQPNVINIISDMMEESHESNAKN